MTVSARAAIITRRTYNRPLDEAGTIFETWEQTIDRVIVHQRFLWERALTHKDYTEIELRYITPDNPDIEWVRLDYNQELELQELRQLMLDRKGLPAGRTLWLGGTEVARRREASNFNCAALNVETIYDVVDAFWLLLQGSGVGFRPVAGTLNGFKKRIDKLEIIRSKNSTIKGPENNVETYDPITRVWTIKIGDSAEAWAKSLGKLVAGKYAAKTLILDFSDIRAAGLRLRNYGWISQGDAGISKAYAKIFKILNKRADSLLTAVDILDIVNLVGTVLSTRRSAEMAVYDYGDAEWRAFATAKVGMWENGNEHRAQSNNSLFFRTKPTIEQLREIFDMVNAGGNGEPGIINGEAMKRRAPWASLTNPCITGDSLVLTDRGWVPVFDLQKEPFNVIVDGKVYPALPFFETGIKPTYKLTLHNGQNLTATENHPILTDNGWKEVKDLSIADSIVLGYGNSTVEDQTAFDKGWLIGEIIGDGGHNPDKYHSYVRFWGDSAESMYSISYKIVQALPYTYHRPTDLLETRKNANGIYTLSSKVLSDLCIGYITPSSKNLTNKVMGESDSFVAGVLRGLFDSDGSVQGNLQKGVSIRLSSINIELLQQTQLLLQRFGILSTIYKNRKPACIKEMPDGKGGSKEYNCKELHELVISKNSFSEFGWVIGFYEPAKQRKFEEIEQSRLRSAYKNKWVSKVESIEYVGDNTVYDCVVPNINRFNANGMIVHNCGEILLPASGGFCCLTTLDLRKFKDDTLGLYKAAHLIARANYRQTVVDFRDGILQEKWHLNNDFLHLCGVSTAGVAAVPEMQPYDYRRLERAITASAFSMAEELGTAYPKNCSTNKPDGTLGKICDTTEGMHKPLGKYIFNNVAFSKYDPLVQKLKDANYSVFNHPYDDTATLVTFPVKYEDVEFDIVEGKEVNLESAVSQLNRYKMLMENYCQQNVSCTVSYDKWETPEIVNWIYTNWDSYVAVSFLFRNDPTKTAADLGYPYLPQEVVTKEMYEEYVTKLLPVDLETQHSLDTPLEDDCSGGACPIR